MKKALQLMKQAPTTEERASKYVETIQRNLLKNYIDPVVDRKDNLEDKIASLLDFSLDTDLNKGVLPITREAAEDRLNKVLQLRYELKFVELELETKFKIFNEFFEDKDATA